MYSGLTSGEMSGTDMPLTINVVMINLEKCSESKHERVHLKTATGTKQVCGGLRIGDD